MYIYIWVSISTPKFSWFISWKIPFNWMMTRGSPISGNLHIILLSMWMIRYRKTVGYHIGIGHRDGDHRCSNVLGVGNHLTFLGSSFW